MRTSSQAKLTRQTEAIVRNGGCKGAWGISVRKQSADVYEKPAVDCVGGTGLSGLLGIVGPLHHCWPKSQILPSGLDLSILSISAPISYFIHN